MVLTIDLAKSREGGTTLQTIKSSANCRKVTENAPKNNLITLKISPKFASLRLENNSFLNVRKRFYFNKENS